MAEPKPPDASIPDGRDRGLLTHRQMLGDRVYVHTRIRLLVCAAIAILALGPAADLLDPRAPGILAILAASIAAYDLGAWAFFRRYRTPLRSADANNLLQNMMYASVVLDYLALSLFVWVTGGTTSPFLPFYVIHAVISHLLLSRRRGISCVVLAFALISALVAAELFRIVPVFQAVANPDAVHLTKIEGAMALLAAYGMLLGVSSFFLLDLTGRLREREAQLHLALSEATRLSELRKDFLRIATHNLQSPVGAVSMQLENLRAERLGPLTPTQQDSISRCLHRMQGLFTFLRDLQTMSLLDDEGLHAQQKELDMRPMLTELVEEHQDVAQAKGIQLTAELPQELPRIRGVERLLREAVVNFVTNALKFTPSGGHVHVRAEKHGDLVRIAVEDDGVGIAAEDQARLFQEFVRLGKQSTKTGNGLGLSIAKRVAEAHGGRTKVWSELGVGSIFTIELPAARAETAAP
jgi:signal transduction histidine kinase